MPVWPLPANELVRVVNGSCGVDPRALAELSIHAANVGDLKPDAGQIFVPVQEDVDGHDYVERALRSGMSLALTARGWAGRATLPSELSARCVVVDDVLGAYRALATHLRGRFGFPVIAVAGSNGKTTTKELIAALLADAGLAVSKTPQTMNGFTGIPFTLCQSHHRSDAALDALVVEIGIDAIGAMEDHASIVRPDVGVITALGAEHLDGLESEEVAAREERKLFDFARQRVSFDDLGELRFEVVASRPRRTTVKLMAGEVEGVITIPIGGVHNAQNLACAVAAVLAAELVDAAKLLRTRDLAVRMPAQRCEVRTLQSGITLIDDGYNASPGSVRAALALLRSPGWRHRQKCIVLGDMLELGDASAELHEALAPSLRGLGELVLVGDAMRSVADNSPGAIWFPRDAAADAIAAAVPDSGVVLIKGSRGMGLERVAMALSRRPPRAPELEVAVVGAQRVRFAEMIAEAMGMAESKAVRALDAALLATLPKPTRAAVFTGFALEDLTPPEGVSPEEFQLALIAQPFLHLPVGGVAVLLEGDEANALLSEAIPAHAQRVVLPEQELFDFFRE